jgi:hypothetical protein
MAWAAPIAGAVIGGVMQNQAAKTAANQTTTTTPWVGAQSGLNTLYGQAEHNFYSGGPQYYSGSTVAPQSDTTNAAMNAMYQRAAQGSPVLSGAQSQVGRTLNDEYLYSNPALGGLMDASQFNAMEMQGMGDLQSLGQGGWGDFYGQYGLNQIGAGSQLGSTLGMDSLNYIGEGGALGSTMGLSDLQRIGSGANVGRTQGSQQLAAIGNGAMLNSNPYVDEMYANASRGVGQQFSNNVMPGIASMFAGSGRYGSEAMQSGMSDAQNNYGDVLNRLGTDIYGQNYANERQLQQQALNQLGNIGIAERGQQLQGLNSLGQFSQNEIAQMMQGAGMAGNLSQNERAQQIQALIGGGQLDATNRQQRLGALNTLTGNQLQGQSLKNQALGEMSTAHGRERAMQMQAASMAPGLAQADYYDIDRMLGVGQMQDQYNQQLINADMARWDFNQNANNNQLAFLNSIMTGASPYRSTNSTGTQPYNPMNGIMGGAMMGQGLYNAYQPASMYAPGGAAGAGFGSGAAFGNQDLGLYL